MESMSQADSRVQKRETQNSSIWWEFRIKGKDPDRRRVEEAEATEEKKWPDNKC